MTTPVNRRRWLGALFLALGLAFLLASQTGLAAYLGPLGLPACWLACLILTAAAILVAIQDLAATRRAARTEEQALLSETLGEIARGKKSLTEPQASAENPVESPETSRTRQLKPETRD
jgi:hypothetical protein